jgi:trk system potassium uptake protein TrkA
MKILIANGTHEADFMIKKFKKDKHKLIVINPNKEFGQYISSNNKVPVICADPTKAYTFDDANANQADVLIALSENDIDNYATCVIAKKLFNIKRTVSVVRNPKRVDLFKQLGVDSVINSTYLLGESIKNESIIDEFIQTISIENDKIVITELIVDENYEITGKTLKNANIPKSINISCIFRDPEVIIPDGDTEISAGDKLVIVCKNEQHDEMIDFIQKEKEKTNGS